MHVKLGTMTTQPIYSRANSGQPDYSHASSGQPDYSHANSGAMAELTCVQVS